MELTLREERVKLLSQKLAEVARARNKKIIDHLEKEWKIEEDWEKVLRRNLKIPFKKDDVRSSFNFKKYMLFDFKVGCNRMSQGRSFDEIHITFEQSIFCENNTLLSFAFHIFDDDIQLVWKFDDSFSDEVHSRAAEIIKNFIIKEMEIPE